MNIRKIINRRIQKHADGVDLVGDVNAVISANVGERGASSSHVSSRQTIVQRSGRTEVSDEVAGKGGPDDSPPAGRAPG